MAKATESQLTISCLQCEWSVETVNTPSEVSTAFLEAAHAHADQHEQHAIEVVQRLRLHSENYVEPAPPPEVREGVANSHTPSPKPVAEEPAAQLQDMTMADIPEDARAAAAKRDPGMQGGFEDMPRRPNH